MLDCGHDFYKQLIDFGGAAKVWMTVQFEYEPVNPLTNKQPIEQCHFAALTRMLNATEQSPHLETPISTPFKF